MAVGLGRAFQRHLWPRRHRPRCGRRPTRHHCAGTSLGGTAPTKWQTPQGRCAGCSSHRRQCRSRFRKAQIPRPCHRPSLEAAHPSNSEGGQPRLPRLRQTENVILQHRVTGRTLASSVELVEDEDPLVIGTRGRCTCAWYPFLAECGRLARIGTGIYLQEPRGHDSCPTRRRVVGPRGGPPLKHETIENCAGTDFQRRGPPHLTPSRGGPHVEETRLGRVIGPARAPKNWPVKANALHDLYRTRMDSLQELPPGGVFAATSFAISQKDQAGRSKSFLSSMLLRDMSGHYVDDFKGLDFAPCKEHLQAVIFADAYAKAVRQSRIQSQRR